MDGQTGILMPPGSSTALAEAIEQMAKLPDLRRSLGEAGRRRIAAEFSAQRMASCYTQLYQRVLHRRTHPNEAAPVEVRT